METYPWHRLSRFADEDRHHVKKRNRKERTVVKTEWGIMKRTETRTVCYVKQKQRADFWAHRIPGWKKCIAYLYDWPRSRYITVVSIRTEYGVKIEDSLHANEEVWWNTVCQSYRFHELSVPVVHDEGAQREGVCDIRVKKTEAKPEYIPSELLCDFCITNVGLTKGNLTVHSGQPGW